MKSIVILTGAGISAESGLPTFRGPDGLWEGHRPEDLATPEAFQHDPVLVHRFYNTRRAALRTVQPNAAHHALARLQNLSATPVHIITQNVDDLHERAQTPRVLHMHGELTKIRCSHCEHITTWEADLDSATPCPACQRPAGLRPHIVWFGEIPQHLDTIAALLQDASLFVAIGTSGHVYPAAGFVSMARAHGAHTLEINNADTLISHDFHSRRTGPATQEVPAWVQEVLSLQG